MAAVSTDRDVPRWVPVGALAVIVVAPYTAVALPFELGLMVQAGFVLAVCCALWACGIARDGWIRPHFPKPLKLALIVYATAALWGAVVGLSSGNPVRFVLSQAFSMLILVFAASAFRVHSHFGPRGFSRGILLGVLGATTVELAVLVVIGTGPRTDRLVLDLPYRIGIDGVAPLAVVVLLTVLLVRPSPIAAFGLIAAAFHLVLSMKRGGWAISLAGAAFIMVSACISQHRLRRRVAVSVSVVLVLIAAVWILGAAGARSVARLDLGAAGAGDGSHDAEVQRLAPRPSTVELTATAEQGQGTPVALFDLPRAPAVELSWRVRGRTGCQLGLWMEFRNAKGDVVFTAHPRAPGLDRWIQFQTVVSMPAAARQLRVGAWADAGQGVWSVSSVDMSAIAWDAAALARQVRWRGQQLWRAILQPSADTTVAYRLHEMQAVADVWCRSSLLRVLIGHGLGAHVPFAASGWSEDGTTRRESRTSYLHNFYVFLAFKLGLAGIAAVGALMLVTVWLARHMTHRGMVFDHRGWFFIAASTAWFGYLVWSMVSPQIYDFRIAPLWGALLAAASQASKGRGDDR